MYVAMHVAMLQINFEAYTPILYPSLYACSSYRYNIVNYILDDEVHADDVAGLATAAVEHQVTPRLTPDVFTKFGQHPVVSTDPLSFLQHYTMTQSSL